MTNKILKEIDAAIAQLQHVRTLLIHDMASVKRETKLAAKSAKAAKKKPSNHRTVTEEGRERMRQAQLKRWAAVRRKAKKAAA